MNIEEQKTQTGKSAASAKDSTTKAKNASPKSSNRLSSLIPTIPEWMRKMPSRNTMIFISVVTSLGALYSYDQYEARRIKKKYIEAVRWRGEAPLAFDACAPRIQVFTSRVPDDEQSDRSLIWWKKYVKPILVSAGIDYTLLHGEHAGGVSKRLQSKIHAMRLQEETGEDKKVLTAGQQGFYDDGYQPIVGTMIVGRNTFKEYMYALTQGWFNPLDIVAESKGKLDTEAEDEILSKQLSDQDELDPAGGPFAEKDEEKLHDQSSSLAFNSSSSSPSNPLSIYSQLSPNQLSSFSQSSRQEQPPKEKNSKSIFLQARDQLPQQPPIVLIPFDHPLSRMRWWPQKIYSSLFCERYRVEEGASAALLFLQNNHRDFIPPTYPENARLPNMDAPLVDEEGKLTSEMRNTLEFKSAGGDCDFDHSAELHYHKAFYKWPENIDRARKYFYKELPAQVKTARELARGEREPTKAEKNEPPSTEVELRESRLNKERRWRRNERAWRLTKPGSSVVWDERIAPSALPICVGNGDMLAEERRQQEEREGQQTS